MDRISVYFLEVSFKEVSPNTIIFLVTHRAKSAEVTRKPAANSTYIINIYLGSRVCLSPHTVSCAMYSAAHSDGQPCLWREETSTIF